MHATSACLGARPAGGERIHTCRIHTCMLHRPAWAHGPQAVSALRVANNVKDLDLHALKALLSSNTNLKELDVDELKALLLSNQSATTTEADGQAGRPPAAGAAAEPGRHPARSTGGAARRAVGGVTDSRDGGWRR